MTPTSPKTASHIGARPTPARSRTATFTAIANAMFCLAIPQGAAGDADGRGDPRGHVVHEGHVRRLDGRVRAHGAHGDPPVRARQHGGVVDAVAHEGERAPLGPLAHEPLDVLGLVGGEELGVVLVEAELARDAPRRPLASSEIRTWPA